MGFVYLLIHKLKNNYLKKSYEVWIRVYDNVWNIISYPVIDQKLYHIKNNIPDCSFYGAHYLWSFG